MSKGSDRPPDSVSNAISGDVSGLQVGAVHGGVHFYGPAESIRRLAVPLPHRVGIVPARAGAFQVRGIARDVFRPLANGETVVLSGLGGVGKTQLAADYVERAWFAGDVDLVVWVAAASREAVVTTYAEAYARLTGADDAALERGARRLLEWLAQTDHRWILVLDDLQDPAHLAGLWPPGTPTGRVIVTTRRRDAALRGTRRRLIDVREFEAEEAHAYLDSALASRPELLTGASGLARDLGFLPLALAQAAAYLLDRDLTCDEYRLRLADRRRALHALSPESLPDEQRSTVGATWSLSVELAKQLHPLAGPLLELVSVLSANGIPQDVFLTEAVFDFLLSADEDDVRDGLGSLHRLSLITHDPSSPLREVRAHTLVQRATRESLSPERLAEVVNVAADGLWQSWPEFEDDDTAASVLRLSVSALRQADEDALWQPRMHGVLLWPGYSLGTSGQLAQARDYFQDLLLASVQRLGPDHPDTLKVRAGLAMCRGEAGDSAGAVADFESLLADQVRVLGPDHPDTLVTRHDLARWRGESGDLAGAVAGFEALLVNRLRTQGPDHRDTLAVRHNLTHWRGAAGDVGAVVAEFELLVADYARLLGPDHPETLAVRHNLAHWRGTAGDVTGALTGFEQLVRDRKRVLGPDHPDTFATRLSVADWRGAAGQPRDAVATLEDLLSDQLRALGPDHIATLNTRFSLAQWRGELGDAADSAETLRDLHRDLRRALGPDHPNVFVSASSAAVVLRRQGEYAAASELDEAALEGRRRVLGSDHPDTFRAAVNLAIDLRQLGDYREARALDEEALEGRRRLLGADHPDTIRAAVNLMMDLRQLGEHDRAVVLADSLMKGWRSSNPETARFAENLAWQERLGVWQVYLAAGRAPGPIKGDVAEAFRAAGAVVPGVSMAGSAFSHAIDEELRVADVVLVLITESTLSSTWFHREIESALRRDVPVIPVYIGVPRERAMRGLPHGIASRQDISIDSASPAEIGRVVDAVRNAVVASRWTSGQKDVDAEGVPVSVELADIRDMVVNAFAAAQRPLRAADGVAQLLEPGPVWIASDVEPTAGELDRFADHMAHGRLGYLVHIGELRGDAQVALDQMRVGGKPVVTVSVRSLKAAYADNRVDAFLTELERDYGNRDNLFDTKNALVNERFLFGRDVLLNTIGSALRRNEHILVTGMRKVGKTSLLNILRQHLVDRPVCQVDLQRFNRHHEDWPPALFALMLKAFDRWGRAEHGEWPFAPARPSTTTELEDELEGRQAHLTAIGEQATTLVVVLDELERIFPAKGEDHAARQWVRASGALRALAQGDRRHVVVVGADLRPIVNRENDLGPAGTNPFFAFFQEMPVTMLERADVDDMIRSLARAMGIDVVAEELLTELFRLTGGHPSLVRTLAAEAYRQRAHQFELTGEDLSAGLDHLDDTDAVGFFLRNNLWQLMTTAEQEVVRALVLGRPVPEFVSRAEERQARAALRAQGLITDEVRIELFRDWLRDVEC